MIRVPRTCRKGNLDVGEALDYPMEAFRECSAYVLLGEPGMGKSETFRQETAATGGEYIRIRDFVDLHPDPAWRGKTLYIDGLDELRAGQADGRSTLGAVRARLDQLGRPRFRLSCREADWLGATDAADLKVVSPDGEIAVIHLNPLDDRQSADILQANHGVPDPAAFLAEAERRGINELLANPQTLALLAEAVGPEGDWPATRGATYELACCKLVLDPNAGHRAATRTLAVAPDQLIDAAAAVCAVLLLANQEGVALDLAAAGEGWPFLADLGLENSAPWQAALATRLFISDGQEDRRRPIHRSVAEYLAARHLARKIDREGLSLRRVLALLTASDGGVVSDLRGVHAWLAAHCRTARTTLIDGDPLGVVFYGDAQAFTPDQKLHVMDALRREAQRFPWFRHGHWFSHPFGALASPDMKEALTTLLRTDRREHGSQAFLDCILEALAHGQKIGIDPALLVNIVRDKSYFDTVRTSALQALFRQNPADPRAALALLGDIVAGTVEDGSDELLGILLSELYPQHLSIDRLAAAFHPQKNQRLTGTYSYFWEYTVFDRIPEAELPLLLEAILARPERPVPAYDQFHLQRFLGRLLAKTVESQGNQVSAARLYGWLGFGLGEHDSPCLEREQLAGVAEWLSTRPERYCAVLKYGLEELTPGQEFRHHAYQVEAHLYGAMPPPDFAEWCLAQAPAATSDDLAFYYFESAMRALFREHPVEAFPLEKITQWVVQHPRFEQKLFRWLHSEIDDWRHEDAVRRHQRRSEEEKRLSEWREHFRPHLAAIEAGTAPPGLLHDLAKIHQGQYIEARGETPRERLSNFLGDESLVAAAFQGLRRAIERADLPEPEDVFALALKGREHLIRLPCLLAMEMFSQDELAALDESRAKRMVAFRLTYDVGNTPDWYRALVSLHPEWVAPLLERYASLEFKAGKEHVSGLYALARDDQYADVARLCLPGLLTGFPLRPKKATLGNLEYLLAGGLRHLERDVLRAIIDRKLGQSSLEAKQKVCWLAAGMVLDSAAYEAELLRHVGRSQARAILLAGCLEEFGSALRLSDAGQATLIRLIAPHVSPQRPEGAHWVSPALAAADIVRGLISSLGASPDPASFGCIDGLLADAGLVAWHDDLRFARESQRINVRQAGFVHASPRAVVATLTNLEPANCADLTALFVDHLEAVSKQIRQGDTNTYRRFWSGDQPAHENDCRDALLDLLRPRLASLGIELQKEGYFNEDKRADIRISANAGRMIVPVEIKKDGHENLWFAQHKQLGRYAADPAADGYGIYLALWFGGKGMRKPPSGPSPINAAELQAALVGTLTVEELPLISIVVIDCARPSRPSDGGLQ